MSNKIQLYSLGTPNGQKVHLALEEMGVTYDAHKIDISAGEQFAPQFLAINPNNKIPAIVDPNGPGGEPLSLFESAAILVYLAEKSKKFLPASERQRYQCFQWLFFQMGGIGPMFGQFGHFYKYAKDKCDHPYPVERYRIEAIRLLNVLNSQLEKSNFILGTEYSIADMACFPWVVGVEVFYDARAPLELDRFSAISRWKERIWSRPATEKAMSLFV